MSQETFTTIRKSVEELTTSLEKLILTLQKDQARKKELSEMQQATPDFELVLLPSNKPCDGLFSSIIKDLDRSSNYEFVLINSHLPSDRKLRHQSLKLLRADGIGRPATLYSCTNRGSRENLHFMWLVPDDLEPTEQAMAIERLKLEVPKFHNRYVKDMFVKQASKLHVNPSHARILYHLATEDASAPVNAATARVDNAVMQYIKTEDPEIVMDLRSLRQNPTYYDEFFDAAAVIIENHVGTAVDDRRHGAVVHMAAAMSAAHLYR